MQVIKKMFCDGHHMLSVLKKEVQLSGASLHSTFSTVYATKHTKLGFPNDTLQSNLVEYLYLKKKKSNLTFTSCAVWLALANSQLPGTSSVLAYYTFKFKFRKENHELH